VRISIGGDTRGEGVQCVGIRITPEGAGSSASIFGHIRVVVVGGAGAVVGASGLPAFRPLLAGGGDGDGGQGAYGDVELFPCGRDPLRAGQVGVYGGRRLSVTADEVIHDPGGGADGHAASGQVRLAAFTWGSRKWVQLFTTTVFYPMHLTVNSDTGQQGVGKGWASYSNIPTG